MRKIEFADGFESNTVPVTDTIAASTISVSPSGNLASTDVQSALSELQADVDGRLPTSQKGSAGGLATLDANTKVPAIQIPPLELSALRTDAALPGKFVTRDATGAVVSTVNVADKANTTDLTAHTGATTGAHAASAISSAALGNLVATNVQSALDELQSDVDTRLLSSAVSIAQFNANKFQGIAVSATVPTSGQILKFNGTEYAPATEAAGAYDTLSATSTTKTPTASGNWNLHSGNSVALTAGTWRAEAFIEFLSSSNPAYTYLIGQWGEANGADSGTNPAEFATGVTYHTRPHRYTEHNLSSGTLSRYHMVMVPIEFTITASKTIFINTRAFATTIANAQITTNLFVRKIK